MTERTVTEAIAYRRSIRVFRKDTPIDKKLVKQCIENATLAATSSNMQLWDFYHITDDEVLKKMTKACLGQNAAKTAKQLVVVITRKDLWRRRRASNIQHLQNVFGDKSYSEYSSREKFAINYYKKLIPTVYFDFFGILGWIKYTIFCIIGIFRPVYRQVRKSDMRIVAHKSAGLAAQNFMNSMAAIDYDTCPMEGCDTLRVKKILGLPYGTEINMVIGCGVRDEKGIYGARFRVPFSEVYTEV